MTTMSKLVSMLQTMRPAYSQTERLFNELYLEPVYGQPRRGYPEAQDREGYCHNSGRQLSRC